MFSSFSSRVNYKTIFIAFSENDTVTKAIVLLAIVFLIRFRPEDLFTTHVRALKGNTHLWQLRNSIDGRGGYRLGLQLAPIILVCLRWSFSFPCSWTTTSF